MAETNSPEPTANVLNEKIQRLERALEHERKASAEALRQERQARERDIRILREALHPFYRAEIEMRKKLVELEDRIEGNYDEQVQMKERLIEVDDAAMMLEKRLDDVDGHKHKRRKLVRHRRRTSRHTSFSEPLSRRGSISHSPRYTSEARRAALEHIDDLTSRHSREESPAGSLISPPSSHRNSNCPSSEANSPLSVTAGDDEKDIPSEAHHNVDSAVMGNTLLPTSMPLFYSTLAHMSDSSDDSSNDEARRPGNKRTARENTITHGEVDGDAIVIDTRGPPNLEVSVRDASSRRAG